MAIGMGVAREAGMTGVIGLNSNGAGVGRSGDEGSRGSHVISTRGETKSEASDGSINGTWDGGTLLVPPKEKS